MVHFIPLSKLPSAKKNRRISFVFRIRDLPVDKVSDCGLQFISQFWKAFCSLIGASVSVSSGYHPQTNGESERPHQVLEKGLHSLVSQTPSSWSKNLTWAEFDHNPLSCSSSGLTSFQCMQGYQPPLFTALETQTQPLKDLRIFEAEQLNCSSE